MRVHLQRDLKQLRLDLLELAVWVEDAIRKAIRALSEGDICLARQVTKVERDIDQGENHIEEECLKMLALHQPVAVDLRRVAAALKISAELERMGDLAEEIAGRALHLAELPDIPIPEQLQPMTDLTTRMVRQSLDAFFDLDLGQAKEVRRLDDEVDRYSREITGDMIERMQQAPEMVEPGLCLFSATRHLERIADHACNIAEAVVYLGEGAVMRHQSGANS